MPQSPSSAQNKVRKRVITIEEIGSFEDLGLGRGVDATNPTPWLNKSAFQVRQVTFESIIGTEEGNLFQGFVNEVESTQHLQTNLKASVPVSQMVNLGIDSELSRSYSTTQKSVGRKIITRTISFRADFDDVITKSDGHKTDTKSKTFEDRLIDWILQYEKEKPEINAIRGKKQAKESNSNTDADNFGQRSQTHNVEDAKVSNESGTKGIDHILHKELVEFCYKFVNRFSITHYVHSLELGASHYRVMSEEEYELKISNKGKLGAGQMADIAIGVEGTSTAKKLQRQTTKIGRMNLRDSDDIKLKEEAESKEKEGVGSVEELEEVKRGSIDEAVVGVKVQPISSLVINKVKLRFALQEALQNYIQNKQKVKCKLHNST